MTQRDMAGYLGITPMTLRNWRKEKPNLYKTVMLGFAVKDIKDELQKSLKHIEELTESDKSQSVSVKPLSTPYY